MLGAEGLEGHDVFDMRLYTSSSLALCDKIERHRLGFPLSTHFLLSGFGLRRTSRLGLNIRSDTLGFTIAGLQVRPTPARGQSTW